MEQKHLESQKRSFKFQLYEESGQSPTLAESVPSPATKNQLHLLHRNIQESRNLSQGLLETLGPMARGHWKDEAGPSVLKWRLNSTPHYTVLSLVVTQPACALVSSSGTRKIPERPTAAARFQITSASTVLRNVLEGCGGATSICFLRLLQTGSRLCRAPAVLPSQSHLPFLIAGTACGFPS